MVCVINSSMLRRDPSIPARRTGILDDLCALSRRGEDQHWPVPARSTTRLRRIQGLGNNDWLVEVGLSIEKAA